MLREELGNDKPISLEHSQGAASVSGSWLTQSQERYRVRSAARSPAPAMTSV